MPVKKNEVGRKGVEKIAKIPFSFGSEINVLRCH